MADIRDPNYRAKRLNELLGNPEEEPSSLKSAIEARASFKPEETPEFKQQEEYLKGSYANRAAQEDFIRNRMKENDWAEVAQTLANAITKYGAARAGLNKGIDLSGVSAGPGIDYSARNDRLLRELGMQSDAADRAEARTLSGFQSGIEGRRRDLEAAVREARDLQASDLAGKREERSILMGLEAEDRREKALAAQERQKQAAELARDARQEKALKQQDLRTRINDIAKEEQEDAKQARLLEAQITDLNAARNAYLNPNTSNKDREKAIEKLKGLSPGERDALDEVKDKQPGFWGRLFGKNSAEAQEALSKLPIPTDLQAKLDELKARKEAREAQKESLGFAPRKSPENKVESSKGPAPEEKIRVRRKADGQTGSILPQDFDPAKYEKL